MTLQQLRERIDEADKTIVDAIAKRMEVVEDIADHKDKHDMEIEDTDREEIVKHQYAQLFAARNLPASAGVRLAKLLIETAKQKHSDR